MGTGSEIGCRKACDLYQAVIRMLGATVRWVCRFKSTYLEWLSSRVCQTSGMRGSPYRRHQYRTRPTSKWTKFDFG